MKKYMLPKYRVHKFKKDKLRGTGGYEDEDRRIKKNCYKKWL